MRGEFDIAVTGTRPVRAGVIFDRFFYDPIVLIAPVSMRLPAAITLRELKKLPLIARNPSEHLMQLVVQALRRVGLTLEQMNVVMQVSGNSDVLSSVALGAGVGFVARSLLAATRQNPEIVSVQVRRLQVDRYIYQIRRENAPFIGGLRLFWQYALSPEWRTGVFSFNTMRL
jgi:DNA-binding transcriptional LysR family regulator